MNQLLRDDYKQGLFDLTPTDGKTIGNASLREALRHKFSSDDFSEEDYWDLRNSLITEGKLEKGRGQGGSVRRILVAQPIPTSAEQSIPDHTGIDVLPLAPAETSLYEPFQKVIQTGYVPDNDLKPWICEITAFQGRRNTGGLWTRPDVTLIAIQTFVYVPDKLLVVGQFEIG